MQNEHSQDKVQGHLGGGEGAKDQDPDCYGLQCAPQHPLHLDNKAAKDIPEEEVVEEEEKEEEGEDPATPVQFTTLPMLMDCTVTMKDALCDTEEMWTHLATLEKFFQWSFVRKQKQKTIQDFFKAAYIQVISSSIFWSKKYVLSGNICHK